MKQLLAVAATLLVATASSAQAVRQAETPSGIPYAVVQMPGGDLEHFAAVVAGTALVPASVAGFPVTVRTRPGAQIWSVQVPAVLAVQAAGEVGAALGTSGAAALAVLGPAPIREIDPALRALAGAPLTPIPVPACALAEGAVEVVQGDPERLELVLPAPASRDEEAVLVPVAADYIGRRLAERWPAVAVAAETRELCHRLVVRLPADAVHPRELIAPVREELARIAARQPSDEDVGQAEQTIRRGLASWAVDAAAATVRLAERLAGGGRVAAALSPPALDPASLQRLVGSLVVGHPGLAVVVEHERRSLPQPPTLLENGIVVHWSWMASDTAVLAMAFGGLAPDAGAAFGAEAATAAAASGWQVDVRPIGGVPTVAVAAPADELTAVLERMADLLGRTRAPAPSEWEQTRSAALGLQRTITADALALAVALPPEIEEAPDALEKFFGVLPPTGVVSGTPLPAPGLQFEQAEGVPTVAAVVDLPPSTEGWIAGEILRRRLRGRDDTGARWLDLPGRLALEISATGEGHVPALDARMAGEWNALRAATSEDESAAAGRALVADLYGDLSRSTLRAAAGTFLPQVPPVASLLAADSTEVSAVLAGLPGWEALVRVGRGPAPLVVVPPGSVQQSRPRQPGA